MAEVLTVLIVLFFSLFAAGMGTWIVTLTYGSVSARRGTLAEAYAHMAERVRPWAGPLMLVGRVGLLCSATVAGFLG
jgi:hypothetical protein